MGLHRTTNITVKVSDIKKITAEPTYGSSTDGEYIDKLLVSKSLYDFANMLRRQRGFSECLFGTVDDDLCFASHYLYVYFRNEIYVRGIIGHCDTAVGNTSIFKYYVQADSVSNKKTYSHRWQAKIKASADLNKAIKNARTHLRPWGTDKIINKSIGGLSALISNSLRLARNKSIQLNTEVSRCIAPTGSLTKELQNIFSTDYKFLNKEVETLLKSYFEEIKNSDYENKRKYLVTLVVIDNVNEEYIVSVSTEPFNPARDYANDVEANLIKGVTVRYTEETLPDDIKFKVASLSMLDFDSTFEGKDTPFDRFVEGLGWRESEHIFYLVDDYE
tara:strand:+ start:606 stop:1601 length:996 start_codon:yes stop_codon:yes gene_type:complete